MIYLLLAILGSSMISILLRLSTGKIRANLSMVSFNYLACSLLGIAYSGFSSGALPLTGLPMALALGLTNGILLLTSFILMQRSVPKNGVVLTSIFTKLGLLVPVALSVVVFRESPTLLQILGFCIAVAAIILINLNPDASGRFDGSLIVLLLLAGGTDAMAKIYKTLGPPELSDPYLLFSFGAALGLALIGVAVKRERPGFWEFLFGTLIGIPNFLSSRFLLKALERIPAVVVYPTFSVSTLLLITLTGVLVFREKLRPRQWVALGAIIIALILLNI